MTKNLPKRIIPERAIVASDGVIKLEQLLVDIDFSDENLVEAIMKQPGLLLAASRWRVDRLRRRITAESNWTQVQTTAAIRARSGGDGETKITEKYIEECVRVDPVVIEARRLYDEARATEEFAKLLIDAYQMRGSMLKALVQLFGAEAATESGLIRAEMERMGVGQLRDKLRKRFTGNKQ